MRPWNSRGIRLNTEQVIAKLGALREEVARINADSRLNSDAKDQRVRPLLREFKDFAAARRANIEGFVKAATAAVEGSGPAAIRRQAALEDPVRTAALRQLAATLPYDELMDLARGAVRQDTWDAALAYALTNLNDVRSNKLTNDQVAALKVAMTPVATEQSTAELADLVVARVEAARFEVIARRGPGAQSGDDTAARLQAAFEGMSLSIDGIERTFSDEDIEGFYELIHLDRSTTPLEAAA